MPKATVSNEEILKDLKRIYAQLKRPFNTSEYARLGKFHRSLVPLKFGSFDRALRAAGIPDFPSKAPVLLDAAFDEEAPSKTMVLSETEIQNIIAEMKRKVAFRPKVLTTPPTKVFSVKRALILPDPHFPYVDRKAYELALRVGRENKVDEIVILGDFADYYSVSCYSKNPSIRFTLDDEVNMVNRELDRLDKEFPQAHKVYIEGNHEQRLTRYLCDQAPALYNFINTVKLFKLDQRSNWTFVPYSPNQKHYVLGSKLIARHEPIGGGEHCASGTVKKSESSVVFGHVHKIQEFQTVSLEGENHRAFTCGWLGDKDSPVMQYVKNHHQWALGFAMVTVLANRNFFAQTVHIIDYTCAYGNKIYSIRTE